MSATTPVLPSLDYGALYGTLLDEAAGRTLPPFWDDALAAQCGPSWSAEGQEYLLRRMMREPTIFSTVRVFLAMLCEGEHVILPHVQKPEKGAPLKDRQRWRRAEEARAFTQGWADRLLYPLKSVCWDLGEAFPFGSKLAEAEFAPFALDLAPFKGGQYLAPSDLSPKPRTVYRWVVDGANRVLGVRPDGKPDADLLPARNLAWLTVGGMDRNPVGEPILAAVYRSYKRKLDAEDDQSKTAKQSGFIVVNQQHPPQGVSDNGYVKVKTSDGKDKELSKLLVAADAMKAARRGMVAALPPGMSATMLQAGAFDFGSIIDRCDREIVAAFVGAARALKEAQNGSKADTGEATGIAATLRDWARGLLYAALERLFAVVLALNFGDRYADVTPLYRVTTEEGEDLGAISAFFQGNFDKLTLDQKNWLAAKIGMPPFPKEDEQADEARAAQDDERDKADADVAFMVRRAGGPTFAKKLDVANAAAQRRVDGAQRGAEKALRGLVSRLASGKLDEDGFHERFAYTLRVAHERAYGYGYAHGDGGDTLSERGEEFLATIVASEGDYARNLARLLVDGEISEDEALRRASLYANGIRESANEGFREASEELGLKLYWDLGIGDHCADCPRYAGMSPWEPDELPTVPGGMETACGRNCTCGLRREDGKKGFSRDAGAAEDPADPGTGHDASLDAGQLKTVSDEIGKVLGRETAWNGALRTEVGLGSSGKFLSDGTIVMDEQAVASPGRWRLAVHEALHGYSEGLDMTRLQGRIGWEEGPVEGLQRLIRGRVLKAAGIEYDEAAQAAVEATHSYNAYVRPLEEFADALGVDRERLYVDLLSKNVVDREGYAASLAKDAEPSRRIEAIKALGPLREALKKSPRPT